MEVVNLYKEAGLTPLQSVAAFRDAYPKYKKEKLSYAGRLDPMAQGVLLVLVGEANKFRTKYLNLDKEYIVDVLFGVSTDTYDILGKVVTESTEDILLTPDRIQKELPVFLGKQVQPYPPYSSRTVQGKPLFVWAREGKISEIEIPDREVDVRGIYLLSTETMEKENLKAEIRRRIEVVSGDFRQAEILRSWEKYFSNTSHTTYFLAKVHVMCSSGTYVRVIAHELGKHVGGTGLAFRIVRTRVGEHTSLSSIRL